MSRIHIPVPLQTLMSHLNEEIYICSLLLTRPWLVLGKAAKLWPSPERLDSKIGFWMPFASFLRPKRPAKKKKKAKTRKLSQKPANTRKS